LSLPQFISEGAGGTAIFLLHGVGGGHGIWAANTQALADAGYRVIAWDAPGYAGSPLVEPYDIGHVAGALKALIRHIGARRNLLLGHSMGGMIAQQAYADFPALIDGLMLSATTAAFGKPGGEWQKEFLRARFAPLDAGRSMASLAGELVDGLVAPQASGEARRAMTSVMATVPEQTYRLAVTAIAGFDQRANLAGIRVPTLVLSGEHDKTAAPSVMERMAARIPGAQYLQLPGVGHVANAERPADFNRAVLDFLKQHFPLQEA
jgi:pimeloyl-ACP methyl ester carboxylesterase